MTAQVPDSVLLDGRQYALCGVRGEGLFDAARNGIETVAPDTGCWRGSVCVYEVVSDRLFLAALRLWSEPLHWKRNRARLERLFGERLALDDAHPVVDADGLAFPIRFTGGVLLGDGLIEELAADLHLQPACRYRAVLELTFESGRLLATVDRSAEMAAVRARDERNERDRSSDLVPWTDGLFRLDY
jgi:hypothetical protein